MQNYFLQNPQDQPKKEQISPSEIYKNFHQRQLRSDKEPSLKQRADKEHSLKHRADKEHPLKHKTLMMSAPESKRLIPKNRAIERVCDQLRKTLLRTDQRLAIDEQCPEDEEEQSMKVEENFKWEDHLTQVIRMQSYWRRRKWRTIVVQIVKKHKYRRSIIRELTTTEQSYLNDMHILQSLKQELQAEGITDKKHISDLFINLDTIVQLSEQMLQLLQKACTEFGPQSKMGQYLINVAPFFRIYYEYCMGYTKCIKALNDLQTHKKFTEFLKSFMVRKQVKAKIDDFLIKPIQRPPKYSLLLQDLLKNTPSDHPDYNCIKKAQTMFQSVNEQNNFNMDKSITNRKLFDLQKLVGNQFQLLNGRRDFKSEESMWIFYKMERKPVIVYFLTDMVVITERYQDNQSDTQQYKLVTHLELDEISQCKDIDDNEYISNIFTLNAKNGSIIFGADDLENKNNFIKFINDLISKVVTIQENKKEAYEKHQFKDLNYQTKYPITVTALGTQEIQEHLNNFTQYIIQIDIANITQKIFIRFKDFDNLQKLAQDLFPKLKLPYVKNQNWLAKNDSKVIEQRKIQIMNFLQILLTSQSVIDSKGGLEILKFLQLPQEFYKLPEISLNQPDDRRSKRESRSGSSLLEQSVTPSTNQLLSPRTKQVVTASRTDFTSHKNAIVFEEESKKKEPIKGNHNIIVIDPSTNNNPKPEVVDIKKQLRSNSQIEGRKISASKLIQVKINSQKGSIADIKNSDIKDSIIVRVNVATFPKNTDFEITITPETRATHAFEDVVDMIQLQTSFDFKLYIQTIQGLRPIEDDELLWSLLVEKQHESTTQKLTKLLQRVSKKLYNYNQVKLYLRKHLYLPIEQEKLNYDDQKRVELISQQFFNDVSSGQFMLYQTGEIYLFTSLYLFIHGTQEFNDKNFPTHLIQQFLSPTTFKQIDQQKETFKVAILETLSSLEDQVSKIQNGDDQNEEMDEFDIDSPPDSISEDEPRVLLDRILIAQNILLQEISYTKLYGLKLFEVHMDDENLFQMQNLSDVQFKQILMRVNKSSQDQSKPILSRGKITLCIGFDGIKFYGINLIELRPVVQLQYADIQQTKAFPKSIVISLNPEEYYTIKKMITLRFDSNQSFAIHALMQEYKDVRSYLDEEHYEYINDLV